MIYMWKKCYIYDLFTYKLTFCNLIMLVQHMSPRFPACNKLVYVTPVILKIWPIASAAGRMRGHCVTTYVRQDRHEEGDESDNQTTLVSRFCSFYLSGNVCHIIISQISTNILVTKYL